jgi:hypothetical protein
MFFDESSKQHYALVDQMNLNKMVPVRCQTDISWDNHLFLSEKQVISAAFYDTSAALFDKVVEKLEERIQKGEENLFERLCEVYNIIDKLMFDLLSNSRELKNLKHFTSLLLRLTFCDDRLLKKLMDERIFIPKDKLAKDEKDFFENLIFHSEMEVREMISDILQCVFISLVTKRLRVPENEHQ